MTKKERTHLVRWRTIRAGLGLVTILRCPHCDARGGVHIDLDTRQAVWCYTCGWHDWMGVVKRDKPSRQEAKGIAQLSMRELEALLKGDA